MLTVGSLFSGIGGLDLGLERAGMKVIWNCEIDPYASRVLKKHWPDIPNIGNIKEVDWNGIERPDVICGGYPCQPFSQAGKRQGENDERHLFPYVAHAIRVLRPRYAIMENVPGHLSLGFGAVQQELAEVGYDSRWDCIPAAALCAPHLRDRVFIIATPRAEQRRIVADSNHARPCDPLFAGWDAPWHGSPAMANTDDAGSGTSRRRMERQDAQDFQERINPQHEFGRFCSNVADTGNRQWWPAEPDVGRVANGIPARMDRLRGLGNAVVPQVAEHIGRIVMKHYHETVGA